VRRLTDVRHVADGRIADSRVAPGDEPQNLASLTYPWSAWSGVTEMHGGPK
jgi:hypothetical protein